MPLDGLPIPLGVTGGKLMPLGRLPIPPGLTGDFSNLCHLVDYSSRLVLLVENLCLSVDYLSRLVLRGISVTYAARWITYPAWCYWGKTYAFWWITYLGGMLISVECPSLGRVSISRWNAYLLVVSQSNHEDLDFHILICVFNGNQMRDLPVKIVAEWVHIEGADSCPY